MADEQDTRDHALQPAITLRTTLAAAAALVLPTTRASADETVAALIARVADKNAAFMRGDMQRWSELVPIAPDFTLFQPFGGDGNLVVYGPRNNARWTSSTSAADVNRAFNLVMQDDGNLVLYDTQGV